MFKQPPTPPIDDDFETIACDIGLELLQPSVYHTPDDSPSTNSVGKTPKGSNSKRVGFVLLPNGGARNARGTKKFEESKPRRSILKQSTFSSDPVSSDPIEPSEHKSFPVMLEQMTKGLATEDVSARYDAYMSINGCLKAYKDLPTEQSLAEKMSVLVVYLRRDLAVECSNGNHKESQMVSEAIKFATQLCRLSAPQKVMTAAFQTFLLNRAISVLSSKDTSKALANLYLYFLSIQEFPSRVMNKEKVNRILALLKDRAVKTQGIQSTTHRLAIYTKLVAQAKEIMMVGAHSWIRDLLNNLASQTKEIRERAISLGFLVGTSYGSKADKTIAEATEQEMATSVIINEQKTTYVHAMIERLRPWVGSRQDALDLTSVWSIIILLLRSKPELPGKWQPLQHWLGLLNECFRCQDSEVRSKANLAWIRFISTISPTNSTSASFSSLLFRPVYTQLQVHHQQKMGISAAPKNHAFEAYLTLLYHAFQPGAGFETLDRYWQEFVVPIFSGTKGLVISETLACRLLISLFGSSQQLWQPDRALETSRLLSIEEMPRLDPRWVRSRANVIVPVLRNHLAKVDPKDSSKNDTWALVWMKFLESIKLAGTKEVKVSQETIQVMVLLVQTFRQLIGSEKYLSASWLLSYARTQLGDLPFLEERIWQTNGSNEIEVISTSTDCTKQSNGQTTSAFRLIISSALEAFDDAKWATADKESVLKSAEFPFTFKETTKLMQATFKTLSVEVRHSPNGAMQMKILEGMQQATKNPGSITIGVVQQVLYFARWLDKCLSGYPLPHIDDITTKKAADGVATVEDTVGMAGIKTASKSPASTKDKGKTPLIPISAPVTPQADQERRRTKALQQQPRLRHDNSQIEFAAIDSSPSLLQAIDSQMLTERQKEVKERQVVESNALFPDISSSSGPKSRRSSTPRLQLSGRERSEIARRRAGSSSPILPPMESMAAHRGSCESPSLRRMSSGGTRDKTKSPTSPAELHLGLDDLPSSPPNETPAAVQYKIDTTIHEADVSEDARKPDTDLINDDEQHIDAEFATAEEDIMPSKFQPALAATVDEADVLVSLEIDEPTVSQPEETYSDSEDVDVKDAAQDLPENEDDDELINSQIDQDIRRASQDAVVAESPRKRKRSKHDSEMPNEDAEEKKKQKISIPNQEDNDHSSKRIRPESSKISTAAVESALPTDLVTKLEVILQQARLGMGTQESLSILRMAAELTQLAVKSVQQ